MKKEKGQEHVMLAETESGRECNLNFKVETVDLLHDVKFLMSEYYVATFTAEGTQLKISFNNGQSFLLKAEVCA